MQIVTSLFISIEGIYWLPIAALFLFLLIFAAMSLHTFRMKKGDADAMSRIPLDNNEPENINES